MDSRTYLLGQVANGILSNNELLSQLLSVSVVRGREFEEFVVEYIQEFTNLLDRKEDHES